MVGGAYKLSYIVSLEMTINERIGVLLWHNFKVFVFLRIPKGGMGGWVLQPPKHPLNPPLTYINRYTVYIQYVCMRNACVYQLYDLPLT